MVVSINSGVDVDISDVDDDADKKSFPLPRTEWRMR